MFCGGAEDVVASISSEHAPRSHWRSPLRFPWLADPGGTIARLYALFADGSESSLARRLAGAAFIIRVVSAVIAFVSQILLARWMGGFDFGIYIYAWTWVLLVGGMVDLGLGFASQRFIPEYTEHAFKCGAAPRSRRPENGTPTKDKGAGSGQTPSPFR